jgi:hypothetical protein
LPDSNGYSFRHGRGEHSVETTTTSSSDTHQVHVVLGLHQQPMHAAFGLITQMVPAAPVVSISSTVSSIIEEEPRKSTACATGIDALHHECSIKADFHSRDSAAMVSWHQQCASLPRCLRGRLVQAGVPRRPGVTAFRASSSGTSSANAFGQIRRPVRLDATVFSVP